MSMGSNWSLNLSFWPLQIWQFWGEQLFQLALCSDLKHAHQKSNYRKPTIRSKKDLWTFHGFQTKSLLKLKILQKMLLLKVFFHLSYKNTQLLFLWKWFLIFLCNKALTNNFWWLRKNKNWAFPLTSIATRNRNLELIFAS